MMPIDQLTATIEEAADGMGISGYEFLCEAAAWLELSGDPRYISILGRMNNIPEVCVDFCGLLEEVTNAGFEPRQWREYLKALEQTPS